MEKKWFWIAIIISMLIVLTSCDSGMKSMSGGVESKYVISGDAVATIAVDSFFEKYLPLILEQLNTLTPTPTLSPTPVVTPIPNPGKIVWKHLSSAFGDLEPPSLSLQQTASLVLDIDLDGVNDFVFGIRRDPGPSVVWYRRGPAGWDKYLIDDSPLDIEAGGDYYDIDQDGDLDIVFGGDGSSNRVWWWENPYPNYDPSVKWTRRTIKNTGQNKHHDVRFGDFDGDSAVELAFWNQGAKKLYLAEIPANPKTAQAWQYFEIYSWTTGLEHEGLTSVDIDGDGLDDLVGGGRWFKHLGGYQFSARIIDDAFRFARVAVGQIVEGGSHEVVFVPGDGVGKMRMYQLYGGTWIGDDLLPFEIDHGHSLQIADVNNDGHKDVFLAEMRLDENNTDAKMLLLLGDGQGLFATSEISTGFGNHESRVADLDGNGTLDILGKPYKWETPRVDIWLNNPVQLGLDSWQRHVIDQEKPWRSVFIESADLNGDQAKDIITGGWWYQNPGSPDGAWQRKTIGTPLNNHAAVFDFDLDGDYDILGTEGQGSEANGNFVWAENNGSGNFTIHNNIDVGDGDFLQGVAVDRFLADGGLAVGLSWHLEGKGVQFLSVPACPATEQWVWSRISTVSQDEAISSSDIDRDGDKDLLLGTKWLRNSDPGWDSFIVSNVSGLPDRNQLADINGDGKLDAVVGFEASNQLAKVAWYEQGEISTSEWEEHAIAQVIGPMSLDVRDMDGDGDYDVVVGEHNTANSINASLFIFENLDGKGIEWQRHLVYKGDEHHDGAQVVDIDNDGDLDIISIGWSHSRVLLYENRSIVQFAQASNDMDKPLTKPTESPTPNHTPAQVAETINTATLSVGTPVPASEVGEPPVALYTFEDGQGDVIFDQSSIGVPLDLSIMDINMVEWLPKGGGIRIKGPVLITSEGPATKIVTAIKNSNQISVEIWLATESDEQNGPARIVSLSEDIYNRNFTLGQENDSYDFRLRTTERSENGRPSVFTPNGVVKPGELTHLVYTRSKDGSVKLFMNGILVTSEVVGGSFSNWSSTYPLILANELSLDRPWRGDLYWLGIYNYALSGQEIKTNYQAGY